MWLLTELEITGLHPAHVQHLTGSRHFIFRMCVVTIKGSVMLLEQLVWAIGKTDMWTGSISAGAAVEQQLFQVLCMVALGSTPY